MTTGIDRAEALSRPAAQFDDDGNLEVRASAALGCRRALWYSATGYEPTNPPADDSLTAMEVGNALEPVVLRAMERAGWKIDPSDPQEPRQVAVRVGPDLTVTGHPDATGRIPLEGKGPATGKTAVEMFLFGNDDRPPAPCHGEPVVIEVKTRGPDAFRRWRTLGAERSHPESVVQAALYTLGEFGELRDAVIATMDTGGRTWDHEVIPAGRLERALRDACERLGELADHHVRNGPDPDALPDRDFTANSWQCRSCPFLDICLPGNEESGDEPEVETEFVSDADALDAVAVYTDALAAATEPKKARKTALDTLRAWMRRQNDVKATIDGRTVRLVKSKRYSVNYRKLNETLDPETRAGIVTEHESEYVRVTP